MNPICGELSETLHKTLDSEIPLGSSVALLDYPNH